MHEIGEPDCAETFNLLRNAIAFFETELQTFVLPLLGRVQYLPAWLSADHHVS